MAIDFHAHIGKIPHGFHPNPDLGSTKEQLISEMGLAGVEKAVVFVNGARQDSFFKENAKFIGEISKEKSLIPFAWLDPRFDSPDTLEKLVGLGFRGLKLHPVLSAFHPASGVADGLVKKAAELHVPVLIHTGWGVFGNLAGVVRLAEKFPECDFVAAHLVEPLDWLKPLKNLCVETSYAAHPRRVTDAVELVGADHVLFGSDFPYSNVKLEKMKVELTGLSKTEKDKILHGNAARLLGLR